MTNDGHDAATRGVVTYTDLHPCGRRPTIDRVYQALDLQRSLPSHPSSREMWDVELISDMKVEMRFEFVKRQS